MKLLNALLPKENSSLRNKKRKESIIIYIIYIIYLYYYIYF